jgi:hypothetical protein
MYLTIAAVRRESPHAGGASESVSHASRCDYGGRRGLGLRRLPLAVEFGKNYRTIGFDLSAEKIDAYRSMST